MKESLAIKSTEITTLVHVLSDIFLCVYTHMDIYSFLKYTLYVNALFKNQIDFTVSQKDFMKSRQVHDNLHCLLITAICL